MAQGGCYHWPSSGPKTCGQGVEKALACSCPFVFIKMKCKLKRYGQGKLLQASGSSSSGDAGLPRGIRGTLIVLGISCHFLPKISLAKCNVQNKHLLIELRIGNGMAHG